MQRMKRHLVTVGCIVLAAIGGVYYYASRSRIPSFPINSADTIPSWNFKGAYGGNEILVAQANKDIEHLQSLIGKGQYDDYDLYIGQANDYGLLGDGVKAYDYYNRAVAVHKDKGLAYANIGHLFDELGAYHTAADAYAKAASVEAGQIEYHLERLTFLTIRFPKDSAMILSAFDDSKKVFGETAQTLAITADWYTGQGRYADAIAAWEYAMRISPRKDVSAIEEEIARLKAKQ